jgi:hypothetical protein
MPLHQYLEEKDVHLVDCAGHVDVELGLSRLDTLERALAAYPPKDGVRRLLVDVRKTTFVSEQAHLELSRKTRARFDLNPDNVKVRVAFVLEGHTASIADNEHWFDSTDDALRWLSGTRHDSPEVSGRLA